jgi:phosphoribosylformimino-5-aminoimidazole carboxamide ribotide isomerase
VGLKTNFESEYDSAYYAKMYQRDNLRGGHVIMLGPGNEEAALLALKSYPGGLQLGGGINPDNARRYLDAGAAGVIVTSYLIDGGSISFERLENLMQAVRPEELIIDLSCRKTADGRYLVVYDRWQKFTDLEVNCNTLEKLGQYCCEFLIHAVDMEGKMSGVDGDLTALLADASPLSCVYAGGISSYDDIELIRKRGAGRIDYTVGSALDIFGGHLSYTELVRLSSQE